MNKLALYVFPLGVIVGGPFLPLAIIMYWVANNIWTFGQQHYVFNMIEKEEEEKKVEAIERRAANAPAPGAKPKRRKAPKDGTEPTGVENASEASADLSTEDAVEAVAEPEVTAAAEPTETKSTTPRPGARPKKRKR
jgi:YidC/Oxa1 family membrane protein insertase